MLHSNPVRWGALGFMLGGLAWGASGFLVVYGRPLMSPHPLYFFSCLIALPLTYAGLMGLHALQEGHDGPLGLVGLYALLVAFALQTVGVAALLTGKTALVPVLSQAGLVAKLLGFVLFGLATLQAGVLARWYGVALVTLIPVSLILLAYGNVWTGLVLLILGSVLWGKKDSSVV